MVPCVSNLSQSRVIVKRVGGRVWNTRFYWRWTWATFSNLIYHFKMDFRSSNVNCAPAIFFYYHTSYVTWSYSHASSDISWENTILHIVMTIQFNFENNTQMSSVEVCIHFFGGSCMCKRELLTTVPISSRHFTSRNDVHEYISTSYTDLFKVTHLLILT